MLPLTWNTGCRGRGSGRAGAGSLPGLWAKWSRPHGCRTWRGRPWRSHRDGPPSRWAGCGGWGEMDEVKGFWCNGWLKLYNKIKFQHQYFYSYFYRTLLFQLIRATNNCLCIYVTVRLWHQSFREVPNNLSQFVKWPWGEVRLGDRPSRLFHELTGIIRHFTKWLMSQSDWNILYTKSHCAINLRIHRKIFR